LAALQASLEGVATQNGGQEPGGLEGKRNSVKKTLHEHRRCGRKIMTGMDGEQSLSSRFLKAYNRLDDSLRKEFGAGKWEGHCTLLRKKAEHSVEFRQRRYELEKLADLRNSIVHWSRSWESKDAIAEPHAQIVAQYERLVQSVLEPPKAQIIAIPGNKICTATLDDCALSVIRKMHARVLTHVPVIQDKCLIGVFSENTVLSFLAANEMVALDLTIKIREFLDFIPLRAHKSETFEFVSRTASLAEVVGRFRENLANRKRLGAVFITENGKEDEELLGLITPWDVAGADSANSPNW
jgi:predicted transcriptional regulator